MVGFSIDCQKIKMNGLLRKGVFYDTIEGTMASSLLGPNKININILPRDGKQFQN